jgi:adenosylhomocysteine nucleosidase
MIAILGVSDDDILYFRNRMNVQETVPLLGSVVCYRGTLSNEEAVVAATGDSVYLAELITGLVIARYEPYLVISVGIVYSFSSQLRQGDIFIPERYYLSDVDFSASKGTKYGQIPGQPAFFVSDYGLNEEAEHTAYLVSDRYVQRGYMLSGNDFVDKQGPIENRVAERFLSEEGLMAYDNSSAGVALACSVGHVTLLTLKAVAWRIGKEEQRLNYVRKGLEVMPVIGQIVARMIMEKER